MSAQARLENAEAAVLELSLFFIRHSLPYWPAQLAPVLQALRALDGGKALDTWARLPLMGEHGLLQLRLSYGAGYRAADLDAEQRHFERLLQQALDTIHNLRLYLKSGVSRPLLEILPDRPL
ncbi:MAG: hypothetical protein K0Q68_1397 [Moraxellaceae bacterium]|jgi:hypothetical protein|nr:hypothetical protein [Moraxellaceae bacterium]